MLGSLRAKEPQYFNRWPLPPVGDYLHAWHSGVVGAMVSDFAGRRVLLDASPQYLMCAAAPPRVQAVLPHSKFIMVVRVRYQQPRNSIWKQSHRQAECGRRRVRVGACLSAVACGVYATHVFAACPHAGGSGRSLGQACGLSSSLAGRMCPGRQWGGPPV